MQAARITIGTVALESAEILGTFTIAVGDAYSARMPARAGDNAVRSSPLTISWQGTLAGRDAHPRAQLISALVRSQQLTRLSFFGDEYHIAVTKFRQRAGGKRASYLIVCKVIGIPEVEGNAPSPTVSTKSLPAQPVLRALVRAMARQAASALVTPTSHEEDKA